MKKPAATREQKKTEIQQLSQAELVEMVLGLQKIIEELQEKLAIATGKSRTTSQTSSKPPSTDLIQKSEKPTVSPSCNSRSTPLAAIARPSTPLSPTIANEARSAGGRAARALTVTSGPTPEGSPMVMTIGGDGRSVSVILRLPHRFPVGNM
jgi:hypothetical protein